MIAAGLILALTAGALSASSGARLDEVQVGAVTTGSMAASAHAVVIPSPAAPAMCSAPAGPRAIPAAPPALIVLHVPSALPERRRDPRPPPPSGAAWPEERGARRTLWVFEPTWRPG